MSRSTILFALAFAASTAAIILPAHALKPGGEKPAKPCTVKKICVQFQKHCWRAPGPEIAACKQVCMKWQETKICD